MSSGTLIRNTTLSNSATKTECHNLISEATGTLTEIVNSDINASAGIVDTKLGTIISSGKVNTSALTTTNKAAGDFLINDGTNWVRLPVGTAGQRLQVPPAIDYMEYSSDALAQAAYVTSSTEYSYTENTTINDAGVLGDLSGTERRVAQKVQLTEKHIITAVEVKRAVGTTGSPSGNWTLRVETDNAGVPSGTLANVSASIVVAPPDENVIIKGTFASSFVLDSGTYHLVLLCDNQSTNTYWTISKRSGVSPNGKESTSIDGSWTAQTNEDLYFKFYVLDSLQSYFEATIKTQGSYALKAVAAITDSLNKTLTYTPASPINLTGINTLSLDMRSTRTGANVKIGLHDSGGTTSEKTYTVVGANAWETVTWDISAVSDANKDAIDSIIVTIVNADANNTFFLDNFFVSSPVLRWI